MLIGKRLSSAALFDFAFLCAPVLWSMFKTETSWNKSNINVGSLEINEMPLPTVFHIKF
jgi:hypothetical protein